MKLKNLLQGIAVLEANVSMELNIEQVAYDSRKVTEGSLFVAITGFASTSCLKLLALVSAIAASSSEVGS